MTYVSSQLREFVVQRAGGRCEYCLYPQDAALFRFEMEHVIAEKHGGRTEADNLALACPYCNRAKGSDIGSIDPVTSELTPLFNPRTQLWNEHFVLEGSGIVPLTSVGRVTVAILQMNDPERTLERARLIRSGRYSDAAAR
jgi:hypothetical protein